MNVYIQTDIEGVAGVTFYENSRHGFSEGHAHRIRMRRLLTAEVNAAARAAFDAGAGTVLINDNHGSGYNIIFEDLDTRCEIIHGRNASGPSWLPELKKDFHAMVLVGMHPMADTPHGLLQHTCTLVNGGNIRLSEASAAAAIAGDLDIPCVFVSGDNLVTGEVKEKISGIETAAVKQSISPYMARSVMPAKACEMIHEGVRRGLDRIGEIKPYRIPGPVTVNMLRSHGGNHDQSRGYYQVPEETVSGTTFSQAFQAFLEASDWTVLGIERPDGFEYP